MGGDCLLSFHSPVTELPPHHFCHILLSRSEPLGPAMPIEKALHRDGNTRSQGHWGPCQRLPPTILSGGWGICQERIEKMAPEF